MRHSTRAGMTPAQLLLTFLIVLGVVFGFYQFVNSRTETAKRAVSVRRMLALETALEKYCVDCAGALPTAKQGLDALLKCPERSPVPDGWRGPYLQDASMLNDGWGRPYKYVIPGRPSAPRSDTTRPYDLASYGRDGCEGGRGLDRDICNWDRSTLIP